MASLTPLAFAALGLLAEAPMHPYEMFQTMLQRHEDQNVKVRPGTLYHQIGRLVDLGYAEALGTTRAGNRPERTTYAITDDGRAELQAGLRRMIAQPADEYPEFQLAVSHIDNLPAEDAVAALRGRADALRAERAQYDDAATGLAAKQLADRFWLDVSYVRGILTAQIEWLTDTADRIASGDIRWDGPAVPDHTPTNGAAHDGTPTNSAVSDGTPTTSKERTR